MADPYGLELSGLDPDTVAELRRLKRQEQMADELAKRGMTPLQGQMVGNVYVRPSVLQGLAGLANSWAAKGEQDRIDEGYKSLGEKLKAVEQAAFDKFQQGFYGSPEKTEQLPEGTFGPPQTTPAVVPDMNSKQQAIIELLRSQSPTAKMVAPMMSQELNRQRDQQEFRDAIKGAMGGGQLTGFEPVQGGVPGQRGREMGFVGDVQKAIQEVATHPNMSIEEKQAAIAQIKEQSAGAGGGQIDPRALLFSGNKTAIDIGKVFESEKAKADAARLAREGKTRQIQIGDELVTQEMRPDGTWVEIGRGPKFAKSVSGVTGDIEKPLSATEERKLRTTMKQDRDMVSSAIDAKANLSSEIARLKTHKGLEGATGYQSYFKSFPSSKFTSGDAVAAEAILDGIKGKIATFGRQMATQHGKLGNMAVQEWKIVADSVANLDKAIRNKDEFINQLANVEAAIEGFEKRAIESYNTTYGDYVAKDKFKEFSLDTIPVPTIGAGSNSTRGIILRFDAQGNPIP